MPDVAPFGSWATPITSEVVVAAAARLGEVRVDGDDLWWDEGRPDEGGRMVLCRRRAGGQPEDVLPAGFSARSRVHEYGGGGWWVDAGVVWFVNYDDQRLYRFSPPARRPGAEGAERQWGAPPVPVSPEPAMPAGDRYADGQVSPDGSLLVCVREHHPPDGGEAVNEIVRFPTGDAVAEPDVLVSGPDFVSNPRISPDGQYLCWLQWDHPRMPWDGTELRVAEVAALPGAASSLVAGGPDESVSQPEWAPDGALHLISDRTGWWNLYRWGDEGTVDAEVDAVVDAVVEPVVVTDAEIGVAQWVFGQSRYTFLSHGSSPDGSSLVPAGSQAQPADPAPSRDGSPRSASRIVLAIASDGLDRLAVWSPGEGLTELDTAYTSIASLVATGSVACFVGASAHAEPAVVALPVGESAGVADVVRPPRELGLDPALLSVPRSVDFPTSGARTAHALFYPPTNPAFRGPQGERPPLLVVIHGGPTSAARPQLQLGIQYWTSRGIAVVDVNYGGSTGYGRAYREQLREQWGVVDLDDCVAAARWLADRGEVDGDRLAIRGGSAGGYTTLAALTFHDVFAAGASHYGVADLEALATETHSFESRYLDGLIGPLPEQRQRYVDRSPIHHVERLDTPLIVFQGDEDEIVPPNQAEMIVEAVRANGVRCEYVLFAGEQHGFRKAENIREALDRELGFYAEVFGFGVVSH